MTAIQQREGGIAQTEGWNAPVDCFQQNWWSVSDTFDGVANSFSDNNNNRKFGRQKTDLLISRTKVV